MTQMIDLYVHSTEDALSLFQGVLTQNMRKCRWKRFMLI